MIGSRTFTSISLTHPSQNSRNEALSVSASRSLSVSTVWLAAPVGPIRASMYHRKAMLRTINVIVIHRTNLSSLTPSRSFSDMGSIGAVLGGVTFTAPDTSIFFSSRLSGLLSGVLCWPSSDLSPSTGLMAATL